MEGAEWRGWWSVWGCRRNKVDSDEVEAQCIITDVLRASAPDLEDCGVRSETAIGSQLCLDFILSFSTLKHSTKTLFLLSSMLYASSSKYQPRIPPGRQEGDKTGQAAQPRPDACLFANFG
jgi:hypothetical protein